LAGHIHDFLSYAFGPERPVQMVVGTGGDSLIELGKAPIVGAEIDGMKVTKRLRRGSFGYFVMDRAAEGWDGVFYSTEDAVLARCLVARPRPRLPLNRRIPRIIKLNLYSARRKVACWPKRPALLRHGCSAQNDNREIAWPWPGGGVSVT